MKHDDEKFHEQIDYLLQQYREGHIASIPDLMKLIQMAYGDYMEFHPNELPKPRRHTSQPGSSTEESGKERRASSSECAEDLR